MPNIGDTAPDFTLLNQDGQPVRLSDYRGRKVVLFAFPKAATSGCTTQACGFRDALPQLGDVNAVVLGISPDQPAALKAWQQDEGLTYDLLADPDHTVLDAWGVWGERAMYGRTYMGVTRSHWVLDEEGRVIDVQFKVSPKDSVARALRAVGATA